MQIAIVFTAYGSNSALGNFAPGDRARCSPQHARHLVEEVKCARYAPGVVNVQAPATPLPVVARAARTRKESKP